MKTLKLSNPYYRVGRAHNLGLDYFISNVTVTADITMEEFVEILSVGINIYVENPGQLKITDYSIFTNTYLNFAKEDTIFELLKQVNAGKEAVCFINEILNVSDELDYPTQLVFIKNIEDNIINSDLELSQKKYPLIAVAVAKHSLEYWIQQINNPTTSLWFTKFGDADVSAMRWPWKNDAAGAAGGFITGAGAGFAGGSIGGPAGSLGGTVIGGVIGGIAGGLGSSVKKFIEEWKSRQD